MADAGFAAVLAESAVAVAVAAAVAAGAFFSGNPNFAARFANISSETPKEASSDFSIGPAFVPLFEGFDAAVVSVAFFVVLLVARDAEVDAVALGLKGIPKRSARAFIACCSGVNSVEAPLVPLVPGVDVEAEEAAGAAALVGVFVDVAVAVAGAVADCALVSWRN